MRTLALDPNPISPLYLAYISPVSPLQVGLSMRTLALDPNPISPLYLAYISPVSPLQVGLSMRTLALDPDSIELLFPPPEMAIPRKHPTKGYPSRFLKICKRYEG